MWGTYETSSQNEQVQYVYHSLIVLWTTRPWSIIGEHLFYCKKDLNWQVSVEWSSYFYRPVVALFLPQGQLFVVCTSLPVSNTRSRLFSADPVTNQQKKKGLVPLSQIYNVDAASWLLPSTRSHCLRRFCKSRASKHVKWGVNRFASEY